MSIVKAKITRIHPEGSSLTDARGRVFAIGDVIEEGAVLTHATPDGATGCISLSSRIAVDVRTVRAPDTAPAPEPLVSADGPLVTLARARAAAGVRSTGAPPAVEVKL